MDSSSVIDADEAGATDALPRWLVVSCGGRSYAVALERVCEIVTARPFTRLPGAGPEVCGLAGVRGRAVTTFDLGSITGAAPARARPDHRLLLVEVGPSRVGLVVEEARRVAGLVLDPGADGAGVPPGVTPGDVLGWAELDGERILGLDLEAMLERRLA
jgi:chemotaxis signal transduction protein